MGRLQDIEDEKLKAAVIRELEKREKRRKRLIGLCIVLATGCIGYFSVYTYMNRKTQDESGKWAQMKEESRKKPGDKKDELVIHRTTGDVEVPDILPEYESLYNINKRLIGWVKIADIDIDYPVMQTVDNEYYLDHDFGQNYDKNGCIFMDKDCDVIDRSTNLIIYGHHMKSGAMINMPMSPFIRSIRLSSLIRFMKRGLIRLLMHFRHRCCRKMKWLLNIISLSMSIQKRSLIPI